MKKLLSLSLALLLVFALSLPALAETPRTLTVSGTATVALAADQATLNIGVYTASATASTAQAENAAVMEKVIAAILAQGVAKEDIITSDFSVYTGYDYERNGAVQYNVNNMLNVIIRNLSMTAAVIDAATEAGANQMYGLNFESSAAASAYDKALSRAYDDALSNAQVLCRTASVELGEILSLDAFNGYGGYYGIRNTYDMEVESVKGAAIVSGDVTVTANISVTYAIK